MVDDINVTSDTTLLSSCITMLVLAMRFTLYIEPTVRYRIQYHVVDISKLNRDPCMKSSRSQKHSTLYFIILGLESLRVDSW